MLGISVVLLALTIIPLRTHPSTYEAALASTAHVVEQQTTIARVVDTVLDRCEKERYLYLGDASVGPFAFTEHSPLGPLFLQFNFYFYDDSPNEYFITEMQKNLDTAEILLVRSLRFGNATQSVAAYIEEHFSTQPWECAGSVPVLEPYTLLFRTKPSQWKVRL